jgi:hypothetical protein
MRKAYLALVFFGLLAFFNAIRHPFVHDDVVFILENQQITRLDQWDKAFAIPAATGGINTYYRPVLEILYRFEYHLFGPHPYGFHFFNCLVHIINGLLVFSLLQRLGLAPAVAWVVSLLFLIHPVQTEAVSCISGISNLWMALGILLGLHAYLNRWYLASLLCLVIACLSKEQAVMFLPLIIIIDISRGKNNFRWWAAVLLTILVFLYVRGSVTGASLVRDIMFSPGELYLRLAAIPRVLGMDLRLIFFPFDLHYYRSTDILQANTMAWGLALLSIIGLYFIFHRYAQTRSTLILGGGWFLAALFPVLNIAPLINEYSYILTAEHFLYLPMIGILIMAVSAADHFSEGLKKTAIVVGVSSCLLLTWHQNTFWANETVLFERMMRFEPDFGRGHLLLANAYFSSGRLQEASGHFAKAFAIMSSYAKKASNKMAKNFYLGFMKEILINWARCENAMGRQPQMDPPYVLARQDFQQLSGL